VEITMSNLPEAALSRGETRHAIEVADETLTFREVPIGDLTPTGAQLSEAAGFKPVEAATVLQFLPNGELEDIRPEEVVDLRHSEGRFVIVASDRLYRLLIDGERFDWPSRVVSGAVLRKLGLVGADKGVFLERTDEPDRLIEAHDLVDLDAPGVESFVSRKLVWKLNVQGVILDVAAPSIVVRDALRDAGFNPDQGWHIFLKVAGQPKRPVELTDTIDLTTPGIEKLRLTPKEVNNGEAPPAPRHEFDLLEDDDRHLGALGLRWETVVDAERRWLLIHDYPVPAGYTVKRTLLALEVPPTYPGAQIYGFYAFLPLALASGQAIPSTQMRGTIHGQEFHGWSRNRGSTPWNPTLDNVATQLALVDAALAKEVGE
jgi:Prokaryotic E2 family E/Multiubiquitin